MPEQYPTINIKGVIGDFYAQLEEILGQGWATAIGMLFQSNQKTETYPWLGMTPVFREWVGGRQPKALLENGISITNKKWELTLTFDNDDLRRDKTGQTQVRIDDMTTRAAQHWETLLSILIQNGETRVCYDGQFFFDTDHSEGASGTQSNDVQASATVTTAPTPQECVDAIIAAAVQMYGFLDDQGEPINGAAKNFAVMCPVAIMAPMIVAITNLNINSGTGTVDNTLTRQNLFNISLVPNPRLDMAKYGSAWTDKFVTFRTDGSVKPFIMQEEEGVTSKVLGPGSAEDFHNDRQLFGLKALRNVGYGYWQHAVLTTFV